MGKRRLGILAIFVIAVVGGVWWWRAHRTAATPATSTVTQPVGAGSAAVAAASSAAPTPARLTITVTDDKGPIAEAAVRLAPDEGDVLVVRTGSDGVAHADALAPGAWSISASATGHEPSALDARELAAGGDVKVTLTLGAGGRMLTGTITDATGGPIAGARIDAAKLGGMARPGRAIATALTGADGRYQLTVAEGQLLVAASSADYAPQSRYVEVGAAGATADFSLVPGGVIEGIVLDERSRQPAPGAIVDARRDRSSAMVLAEGGGHHAIVGADGRFRITGLRPGAYELRAHDVARTAKHATLVGVGVAEQITEVELLIGTGPVVRGTVVDDTGAPVPGITVAATGREGDDEALADAKGAFAIAGLAPGQYFVTASSAELVPAGGTSIELADKDLDGVKVHVRRGTKIMGHIEPRQSCEVAHEIDDSELGPQMPTMLAAVTTQVDGEFSIGPATAGKAKLTARCASGDQGSLSIDVRHGMAEVVIEVRPGASIAGRVIDGEGKGVAGATVMAAIAGPTQRTTIVNGMVTSGVQAITGANGGYELKGLSPGSYRMAALDRGKPLRDRGKPVTATVAAREAKTGVDLAVDRPTGVIKGTVTGPDGKPLADAWVSASQDFDAMIAGMLDRGDPDGESGSRTVTVEARDDDSGGGAAASEAPPALTDAQGHFELGGLPHTRYQVVAEAQAGKLRGRAANVTPDATVAIQARGVTSLSGTVRGPSGPVALFSIELDGPTTTARTFTDGTFQLGRVDPGTYTVRVTSKDGNGEAKVQVVAGQPATVDIVLAANAIVVGTIVDAAGKPLPGIAVTLVPDSGDGRLQIAMEGPPPTSGPDGKFRLESKPGLHILVALTQPRPVTRRGLTLEAGRTLDVGAVGVESGPPHSP